MVLEFTPYIKAGHFIDVSGGWSSSGLDKYMRGQISVKFSSGQCLEALSVGVNSLGDIYFLKYGSFDK